MTVGSRGVDFDHGGSLRWTCRKRMEHLSVLREIDLCIAKARASGIDTTPASCDSDYTFQQRQQILRQDFKKKAVNREIPTDEIFEVLDISPVVWKVAAVVSGNDFSSKVPGLGIASNIDILRSVPVSSYENQDTDVKRMELLLRLYCCHGDITSKVAFAGRLCRSPVSSPFCSRPQNLHYREETFSSPNIPFTNEIGDRICALLSSGQVSFVASVRRWSPSIDDS